MRFLKGLGEMSGDFRGELQRESSNKPKLTGLLRKPSEWIEWRTKAYRLSGVSKAYYSL